MTDPRLIFVRTRPALPPAPKTFSFDGVDDGLSFAWNSTATDAERRQFTVSFWGKSTLDSPDLGSVILVAANSGFGNLIQMGSSSEQTGFFTSGDVGEAAEEGLNGNTFRHFVIQVDSPNATAADRVKIFRDSVELTDILGSPIAQNYTSPLFTNTNTLYLNNIGGFIFSLGKLALIDICPGNLYPPTAFAFDDGGTWTAIDAPAVDYGTHGGRWDGTDGFNDVSGNGWNFTDAGGVTLDALDVPPHQ